jgi:hypothetical protein
MDEIKALHRGEMALKPYDDCSRRGRRLMKTNPRLTQDKADWLAQHWAAPNAQGQWEILGDPAHKIVNASCTAWTRCWLLYARITAPVLAVEGQRRQPGQWWKGRYTPGRVPRTAQVRARPAARRGAGRGHMLHHDQPGSWPATCSRNS